MPDSTIIFSNGRRQLEEALHRPPRAEAHHALDARAVVPAAVQDHDLAGRRQVRQIALDVHLALLALGRRGQRDDAEHARAHALGDRLDGPALAGAVAALEHDADLEPLVLDPLLQLDQLDVQLGQLLRRTSSASACPSGLPPVWSAVLLLSAIDASRHPIAVASSGRDTFPGAYAPIATCTNPRSSARRGAWDDATVRTRRSEQSNRPARHRRLDRWETRGPSVVPWPHSGPRTTSALGAPPTRL